jgi:putative tryptophan/tyrosine transport system substrate-binding protein
VPRQRPFIGMFMNLAEDDREVSARREAFLQGFGPNPAPTIAASFGGGDFGGGHVSYHKRAQALRDLRVGGAGPDLYLATCWPSLRAIIRVAGNTPIVFAGVANLRDKPAVDPEREYSLPNVYGFISYGKNLCRTWVDVLRAVRPDVAQAAVIYDMNAQDRPGAKKVYDEIVSYGATRTPQLKVTAINCGSDSLDDDLKQFARQATGTSAGLIVGVSVLAAKKRKTIIEFAKNSRLPAVYPNRLYTLNGGLISKGTYIQGLYHSAGQYARRIINEEHPTPRIDTTQTGPEAVFETVVNASTARAIGLELDPAALGANLVIDEG